jgi:hypothetical protein
MSGDRRHAQRVDINQEFETIDDFVAEICVHFGSPV